MSGIAKMRVVGSFIIFLLMISCAIVLGDDDEEDICDIDGWVFYRGENVGSAFESRCGPWETWPCFCNPDSPLQVDCPYCAFATTTEGLVRCARHDEVITFISLFDNLGKRCVCDASDPSFPVEDCEDDEQAEMCQFDVDGESYWYAMGDSVDVMDVCGDRTSYPCYCDPNINGQLECPYCTITHGDTVECIKDQESKQLNIFGQGQTCECDYSRRISANFPADAECGDSSGCAIEDDDGSTTFYGNGDEIEGMEGDCGDDYPYICDTSGLYTNNLKYPYCIFKGEGGQTVCARDGQRKNFVDENNKNVLCECEYSPSSGATETCTTIRDPTPRPTPSPVSFPTRPPSAASTIQSAFLTWITIAMCTIVVLGAGL